MKTFDLGYRNAYDVAPRICKKCGAKWKVWISRWPMQDYCYKCRGAPFIQSLKKNINGSGSEIND